jgi:glycosyltransferase involved in cell wall biosynthesis
MYDLSVIIPARNEMFLLKTIEEVLSKSRGNTECIVVLDGYHVDVPRDPRVTVIHNVEPRGQRGAINDAARLSTARYIMKLDAHCQLAEGFDVTLIESAHELGREVTQIPLQYNLHAFDWVCPDGHRRYQSPSGACTECGKPTKREIVWQKRDNRKTWAWRFDADLHFQYWHEWEKTHKTDYVETMSLLGACFFMDREWYWELGGSDEDHGSWGQQGTEIACKSWLSGGRVICNRKTWYAHMFRTQGGDFSFPYPLSSEDVAKARKHSQDYWRNGRFPKAIYDLEWLVARFNPPGWEKVTKGVVYYTDSQLPDPLANTVREQIKQSGLPVVSVSLNSDIEMGHNIRFDGERGYLTMFKQILAGLEASTADVIFLCEHDVLYHPSHFSFTPPRKDVFYYNTNVYQCDGARAYRVDDRRQVSGLCAYRELLLEHYRKRVALVEERGFSRNMGFEPGTHKREERVDDHTSDTWESAFGNVDLKHKRNLTSARWHPSEFRNQKYTKGWKNVDTIDGWGSITQWSDILTS